MLLAIRCLRPAHRNLSSATSMPDGGELPQAGKPAGIRYQSLLYWLNGRVGAVNQGSYPAQARKRAGKFRGVATQHASAPQTGQMRHPRLRGDGTELLKIIQVETQRRLYLIPIPENFLILGNGKFWAARLGYFFCVPLSFLTRKPSCSPSLTGRKISSFLKI